MKEPRVPPEVTYSHSSQAPPPLSWQRCAAPPHGTITNTDIHSPVFRWKHLAEGAKHGYIIKLDTELPKWWWSNFPTGPTLWEKFIKALSLPERVDSYNSCVSVPFNASWHIRSFTEPWCYCSYEPHHSEVTRKPFHSELHFLTNLSDKQLHWHKLYWMGGMWDPRGILKKGWSQWDLMMLQVQVDLRKKWCYNKRRWFWKLNLILF